MRVDLKPKGKRGHNKVSVQVVLLLKVVSDLPRSVSNKTTNRKTVGDSILVDLKYDDREYHREVFSIFCSKDRKLVGEPHLSQNPRTITYFICKNKKKAKVFACCQRKMTTQLREVRSHKRSQANCEF